PPTRH
ncbi:hypothetical protein BN1708_019908, partial [Verticillium longisporum]